MFKEKYGEQAAREYVQHLADDLNGKFNHLIEDAQALMDKNLTFFQRFALFRGDACQIGSAPKKRCLFSIWWPCAALPP